MATRLLHDGAFAPHSESQKEIEFEELVRRELELLGENPAREGLQRTPYRVAHAMKWLTQGYASSAKDVVG
jgi:GTP cyclohydrolase I